MDYAYLKRLLLVITILAIIGVTTVFEIAYKLLIQLETKDIAHEKITCSDFTTLSQAKRYMEAYPQSAGELDRDGDGIPCENLTN